VSKTYVPGYGYVDATSEGTRGSVGRGPKPRASGQRPTLPQQYANPLGTGQVQAQPRPPQYSAPIGPGLGSNRPPQYSAPIGPGLTPQYAVAPDGQIVVTGQPGRVSVADIGKAWISSLTGGSFSTGSEFDPNMAGASLSAYQTNPPTDMYKAFEFLRPEEKNFWALMAANYHSSSTPEAQYAKFAEIAMQQGQASGVWANPLGIAMRHARDMNYDMRNVYVPGGRASIALRRGTEQFDLGVYDSEFEGFGSELNSSSSGGGYGGGGYGGGGGGGSVSLTDPTSARGLLMQTMQGVLGRNPTNQEYRQFLDILNESEMSNPRTVSFEGDVAVQSGGVDPSVLALEFAQDQEDFTERQGDQYFQTFMRSLAGGV
jgi:hypothetical protein